MVDDLIGWMSTVPIQVVALDIPSGIDASTGDAPTNHVRATATMTLALPKTGLHADAVGELWVSDIGIPRTVFERAGVACPPARLFSPGYTVRLVRPFEDPLTSGCRPDDEGRPGGAAL